MKKDSRKEYDPDKWMDFPAWGYYIRHADNVVFTNVTYSVSPDDAREDIVLEDVEGFVNH